MVSTLSIFTIKKKKIYLFRDPFGIRPIYYYQSKDNFIFSSEIKAIIKTKISSFNINEDSLAKVLCSGLIREMKPLSKILNS